MVYKKRTSNRIPGFDYSAEGAYFLTICTLNRKELLSKIRVGTGLPDCPGTPEILLTKYGIIAEKYIKQLNTFYQHISIDKYVIMPDHIHLLICISYQQEAPTERKGNNSEISKFVSTLKRFCNKDYGENIWQGRYYDHVVRNQKDYQEIWEYIDHNPMKWILMQEKDQG